jgi:hypothetical protein
LIRISGIRLAVDEDSPAALERALLYKLGIKRHELLAYSIFRQSIDARDRRAIRFVYTVDVRVRDEARVLQRVQDRSVAAGPMTLRWEPQTGGEPLDDRPVVVGTGPAGLFVGLVLARLGFRPLLLERGADVERRTGAVWKFWQTGALDPECNVQFGEGGAGTFSDGKLTTLIRDPRCRVVLDELVAAGAPPEIIYSFRPHLGTDKLCRIVKNIREQITVAGGEVRFYSRVTDLIVAAGRVTGVVVNDDEWIPCRVVVLAPGHSARDTLAMLLARGVRMRPKPFSIGIRIEHPQGLIDRARYGRFAGHPKLSVADYKLVYHAPGGRSAYTFCMCPGGVVVAAASEPGHLVTNGMSVYARDGENANSALLVGVTPDDFGGDHPLAGVEFQRTWESRAFAAGGGDYRAPVQLLADFLHDRAGAEPAGAVRPTYQPGVRVAELKHCLPVYVVKTLREAIPELDRKLEGFALPGAVLTGVETRSSSPVQLERDQSYQSNLRGLYPAGEGPGYAGGIISSAVDGIRVAEAIAARYRPFA